MRQTKAITSLSLKASSFGELGAPVEVRRHPGARRLTLRVSRTRRAVIVTLPIQCDLGEAGSFLNRNIAWVRERLDSLPEAVPFRDGVVIPLRGAPHRIVMQGKILRGIVRRDDRVEGPRLVVPGSLDHAPRRLRDWLWSEAHRDLDDSVAHFSKLVGVTPKRITVRDQASRWGSCSTTGQLSFSWRLVLAPPIILNYVAAHEVAHLKEMNHGPRFWSVVERVMPEMREARRWLQLFGMDLHRYGTVGRTR